MSNLFLNINSTNGTATVTTSTGTAISTTNGTGGWFTTGGGTNSATTSMVTIPMQPATTQIIERVPDHIVLMEGKGRQISFPDGTEIFFNADGSFEIEDKDAKVIYKAARMRDFNPFINASDKLEDFIKFCGDVGVRQGDMLSIPIKQFIQWLVIEAARADGEDVLEVLKLPVRVWPRCQTCGRFISRKWKERRMEFCRPSCFEIKYQKEESHDKACRQVGLRPEARGDQAGGGMADQGHPTTVDLHSGVGDHSDR